MLKKSFFLVTLFYLLANTQTQAQSEDYPNVISAGVGYSTFQTSAFALKQRRGTSTNAVISATPTYQLTFDRSLNQLVSIGGAISYNKGAASDSSFVNLNVEGIDLGKGKYGYVAKVSRTTVSGRILVHYGNPSRFDIYSGARLGVGIWQSSFDTKIEAFGIDDLIPRLPLGFVLPTVQVIPFGIRGYLTDNLGVGAELAIGSPYVASLQLNYRIAGVGRNNK